MIRLGWRLAFAGGGSGRLVTALTALAVALGTAILLFALSFEPALQTRYDHAAWRDTPGQVDPGTASAGLILQRTDDHWHGLQLTRMDVAPLSTDAPVPPGLDRVPLAGEAYVSPALARLIAASPPDELGDRFGAVAGTISDAGLMAPDELAVVVGRDAAELRAIGARPEGARVVTALDGTGRVPMPSNPMAQLLVVIAVIGALAPVAVFVAVATRLSAARRERRLAAMRLVGATPSQVTVLAAVEALLAAIPGALGGIVLFVALRPLVARMPLLGAAWFPESITPPVWSAAALVLAVLVTGVASAVVALRGLIVSPLGVQRRERPGPLRRLRLLPLAASAWSRSASTVILACGRARAIAAALWSSGPVLRDHRRHRDRGTVGHRNGGPAARARRPAGRSALLAGRRLADDPRGSFGAIGGVVLAVFIGSAYLSIAGYAAGVSSFGQQRAVRPDVPAGAGPRGRVTRGRGAYPLVRTRPGSWQSPRSARSPSPWTRRIQRAISQLGVLGHCADIIAVLQADGLRCGPGLVHLGPSGVSVTRATVSTAIFLGGFGGGSVIAACRHADVPATAVDRYARGCRFGDRAHAAAADHRVGRRDERCPVPGHACRRPDGRLGRVGRAGADDP